MAELEQLAVKLSENPKEARAVVKQHAAQLVLTQKNAREAFHKWRREHTVFLISSGVLLGATIFGTALYLYLDKYPSAIEFFVVEKTVRAFDKALSFESRKKVYLSLPEPTLPNFDALFVKGIEELVAKTTSDDESRSTAPEGSLSAEDILFGWADMADAAMSKVESTWMLAAKLLMREQLLEEISELPMIDQRLRSIAEIIPASVERNQAVSREIDRFLESGALIPGATIARVRPQYPEQTCDAKTAILVHAIAFFPGPINKLLQFLDHGESPHGASDPDQVVLDIVNDLNDVVAKHDANESTFQALKRRSSRRILERTGVIRSALEKTLIKIKRHYDVLSDDMKAYVLGSALRKTINNLQQMPRIGDIRPYDLYERAIDNDLIGPLRRDARISEDILREVKHIFLAMPGDLQARVLLTALRHPLAQVPLDEASPEAQAELVRDLLSSGGVVAVKLAQMLAEHPKMPQDYQEMLGSLRDDNEPMPIAQFWWQIPSAVRSVIKELGPCLGTGSVKQANLARLDDDSMHAVVVLRSQVEDEALSSIGALETSEELGPVATRLGRLVYGEFNLHMEGEVLEEFAATQIGQHPMFHVVKVRHHSPKCLVEEIARGCSVATVLERPSESEADEEDKRRAFDMLVEYHKTVMAAFMSDGVIHSDIHLGNANYVPPEGDQPAQFYLFDVGQFDRIGLPDTKALLWTLAAMSSVDHRATLKNVAVAHLASTSTLKDRSIDASKQGKELRDRLSVAFAEAIEPNAEGEHPDKRTAYMLFLRAAERHGVNVPKGAFSVAKMVDGIVSQQERYDLPLVVDEAIEKFLRSHMTWGELADIGARTFRKSASFSS